MAISRYGRIEERKQRRKLLLAVVGSLALIIFFVAFGMKLLVGFSVFVGSLHSGPTPTPQTQVLILPPALDPLPAASNSGSLTITGTGQQGLTLVIYMNDNDTKELPVPKSGSFSAQLTGLKDGSYTISAKLVNDKGNTSDLSNIITTSIKKSPPTLDITSPNDNTTINGDNNVVTISGKSDDNTSVTVNNHVIVLQSDNSFSYQYPLSDGDNKLSIQATDQAGNTTTVLRTVTYHK